jgi:hypothetical protein
MGRSTGRLAVLLAILGVLVGQLAGAQDATATVPTPRAQIASTSGGRGATAAS